jgi:hypothetical protein
MSVYYECCVLSGRDLCVGLIIRPEETYRFYCVSLSVITYNNNPLHLRVDKIGHKGQDRNIYGMKRPWPNLRCYPGITCRG